MTLSLLEMRDYAMLLFETGVSHADPFEAVQHSLDVNSIKNGSLIIAVGKAAIRMTKGALSRVPDPSQVIVVTNYENTDVLKGAQVFAAGHPVPDDNGLKAAHAVRDALMGATGNVLALISGGGSALLPAPAQGISLADKQALNRSLLSSGPDIQTMNLIRQNVSILKGGGFLRLADPAKVRALIISDVVGDDLRAIASGPTVAPLGNKQDAIAALKDLGLWDDLAQSIKKHLSLPEVADAVLDAQNEIICSNQISLAAMAATKPDAKVFPKPLIGDVSDAAQQVLGFASKPGTYLFGGETTVKIAGSGKGGRNQELALRVALLAERAGWTDWAYLQGGTDGRDGPTDAAGGLVDAGTLARARAKGIDPMAILANNDSYNLLAATSDLLMTGATGTNVADLGVLIRG